MIINQKYNENLTDFGKATLEDRYLMPDETCQDLFARVAKTYGDDDNHSQRLYEYMANLWFMPATPILSNGGTTRGLPISCMVTEPNDNMADIIASWVENAWLSVKGAGIGCYWGNIRSTNEKIAKVGGSSGVIPFLKVQDSLTLAVSQGGMRRASAAIYLPIWHPEIEEFIEIRRATGGDPNRRCLNLNNAIVIDDKFMEAVKSNGNYNLISPKDGSVFKTIKARDLWIRILIARVETGEPYIMFLDTVNELRPQCQKDLGLKIKTSQLCSEITLPTGIDHLGVHRTAVCCLSSLNLEKYDEWKLDDKFIPDIMAFLDNVLQDFIDNAPASHARAVYSAMRERSVGLGVMGLHGYLQSKSIPWESKKAKGINIEIFERIQSQVNIANTELAFERGACPDAAEAGYNQRFSNATAIAPTASISVICGGASPGIEPSLANAYMQKTLSGSFLVKNKHLEQVLTAYGMNTDEVWSSIMTHDGSVQQLEFLEAHDKSVFKTAFELDQMSIIDMSADRTPYIDQAQSVNIFLPANVSKKQLHELHFQAWEKGLKTLYYCRSQSVGRSEKVSHKVERVVIEEAPKYEECTACQ